MQAKDDRLSKKSRDDDRDQGHVHDRGDDRGDDRGGGGFEAIFMLGQIKILLNALRESTHFGMILFSLALSRIVKKQIICICICIFNLMSTGVVDGRRRRR